MHCTITVNATELKTVRVVCKLEDCGAVFELPVNKLDSAFPTIFCPACKASFKRNPEDTADPFTMLAKAIREIKKLTDRFGIEFVLPQPNALAANTTTPNNQHQ